LTPHRDFYVDVPYSLIQSVRLVHALMETGDRVHIRPEHRDRFSRLEEVFGVTYAVGVEGVPRLPAVHVDHSAPRTSVGSILRPLIFPHAIVQRCRTLWADARTVRFSFAGLVTDSRRQVLGDWLQSVDARAQLEIGHDSAPFSLGSLGRAPRRLLDRWRRKMVSVDTGEVVFWASRRGRHFPGKSWDEEYFKLLSRSQFVLCPSGDHVWTYRFFEAALCGALPIVEKTCDAYSGFRYAAMTDPVADVEWRSEDAEHNYARCRELLTVAGDSLRNEIASLLAGDTIVRSDET
jgi:hypothetical protein